MTRGSRRCGALLVAVLLAGCAVGNEDGKLVILNAVPLDSEECQGSVSDNIGLSSGVVDMAMARYYRLYVRVENNMADINTVLGLTAQDGRLETTRVRLRRAVVTYQALDQISANFPDELRVPLSASVDNEGGRTSLGIEVLTEAMIQDLRSAPEFIIRGPDGDVRPARTSVELLVTVAVQGETFDGQVVESNEFTFPLTVCNGCLVAVPPDAVRTDKGVPQPNCLNLLGGAQGVQIPECGEAIGRDAAVDCRICYLFAVDAFARQLCQPAH